MGSMIPGGSFYITTALGQARDLLFGVPVATSVMTQKSLKLVRYLLLR